MILNKTLSLATMFAFFLLVGSAFPQDKDEEEFVPLFNGKDLSGFKVVLANNKENVDTFTIEDSVVNVSGNPGGYLQTEKSYQNYVLCFDWKFPSGKGNSGCLVHIKGKGIWPTCFEVQGAQESHGTIVALGNTKGTFTTNWPALEKTLKIGEWNSTEIISKDGELTSKVNGIQVCTGTGKRTEGYIGWQSEGAQVLFKNIRIKELPLCLAFFISQR